MSVLLFLNRHGDLVLKRGGGVALQLEAVPGEGVEIPDGGVHGEAGRGGAGVLPQQLFDNGNVPVIDVGVGDDVDQLARLQPGDLGEHVDQRRVLHHVPPACPGTAGSEWRSACGRRH